MQKQKSSSLIRIDKEAKNLLSKISRQTGIKLEQLSSQCIKSALNEENRKKTVMKQVVTNLQEGE